MQRLTQAQVRSTLAVSRLTKKSQVWFTSADVMATVRAAENLILGAPAPASSGVPEIIEKPPYSVEKHGSGWAIYQGRSNEHHGHNLGQLSETDETLAKLVESALNSYVKRQKP